MRGLLVLASVLFGATAFAQGAADIQLARTLGTEGLKLAEAGDCAGAIDKLSRAEKLHHAPTTEERLGECQVSVGRYVDGTENLRSVIRERLAPGAPGAFAAAKSRAQKALDAALPHVGKLKVDVAGPASGTAELVIDGQKVSSASVGLERPIDPGSHVVEASAPGYKPASAKVDVADGGSQAVTLTLEAEAKPKPTETTVTHRVYWPAVTAFGVAGAGVVLTGIFGALAIVKKNDLVGACGGTSCPPTERGTYNDATAFASVANVGLIIAGVAAAAGVVLLLLAPKRVIVEHVAIGPGSLMGTF